MIYNTRKQSGFSLIEVLISSFILAFGLLGLAGMQSTAIKLNIESQQRTLANSLAIDITSRMQLNKGWLMIAGNSYEIESLAGESLALPTCVSSGGVFNNCNGGDIKNNDLYEWKQKFLGSEVNAGGGSGQGLIGADACISISDDTATNGEVAEIVISWFSTLKSKDAASGESPTSLRAMCGTASSSRRQVSVKTYISKSL
jgi:type IV pilus assembly protein PilV